MLKPRFVEILESSLGLAKGHRIFTSLEGENPGGSIKDHMVLGELHQLQQLKSSGFKGVSEVSAGSTALSLAYYSRQLNMPCVLFVPTTASSEVVARLQALGAEVHQEDLAVIYEKYDQVMATRPELFRFNQLYDENKRRHYHAFGHAVKNELGAMDAVIGSVGTGHSLRGVGEGIDSKLKTITAEPDESYKIPGVRNILLNRYGEQDALSAACFLQRTTVPKEALSEFKTLRTDKGEIEVGPSFSLVLAALKAYLVDKTEEKIFAVGAANKSVKL